LAVLGLVARVSLSYFSASLWSVAGIKGVCEDKHGLICAENQFFIGGHPA
jgi:hypothetical protein